MNKSNYLIGITGKVGSGKSTVAEILSSYGYEIFDTDVFSKELIKNDKYVYEALKGIIGENIIENGHLNFKKIGKIFDDDWELEKKFESWYQVYLGNKIKDKLYSIRNKNNIVFCDIPLIANKGIESIFDEVWVVETKYHICYERIKKRNNYDDHKTKLLLENSETRFKADIFNYNVIENNGSIEELVIVIDNILKNLVK